MLSSKITPACEAPWRSGLSWRDRTVRTSDRAPEDRPRGSQLSLTLVQTLATKCERYLWRYMVPLPELKYPDFR